MNMKYKFIKLKNNMEFSAITIFFICAVLLQGLYFFKYYLPANILLIIYVIFLIRNNKTKSAPLFTLLRDKNQGNKILGAKVIILLIGIFTVLHMVSVFYAIDKIAAINEAIRAVGFPFAILIGAYVNDRQMPKIEKAVVISGIISALIGIITFSELINIEGSIFNNRIQSTFQYANTAALYFAICIIILFKYINEKKNTMLINISVYILLCSFILTYSRGMWILFGVFSIFALFSNKLIEDKHDRVRYFFILLASVLISVALASQASIIWYLFMFFTGMVICILPEYADKKYYIGGTVFLMVCIVVFSFIYKGEIYQRIMRMNINATEWILRISYYRGAIAHIYDYPLLGTGPGGWAVLSKSYAGEYVKFIHNYYLQITCDLGIVGLIVFLLAVIGIIRAFIIGTKKNWHLFFVFLIMLLHAFIDIGLHFHVVSIIFFICAGYQMRGNHPPVFTQTR